MSVDDRQEQLIAVYGTLKRGEVNAHWLHGARYLGVDHLPQITLYNLGPYPGAQLRASTGVPVEVYALNAQQLRRVDELEDYDALVPARGLYDRQQLPTRFGAAWVYLYNGCVRQHPVIAAWPA